MRPRSSPGHPRGDRCRERHVPGQPTPYASDVKHSIKKALERDAKLEADNIEVETMNGRAILTGSVRSWTEHDAAVAAAWSAPGVNAVDDRLSIYY